MDVKKINIIILVGIEKFVYFIKFFIAYKKLKVCMW